MNKCIIIVNERKEVKEKGKTISSFIKYYKTHAEIININIQEKVELYNIYQKDVITFKIRKCNKIKNISEQITNYEIEKDTFKYKIISIDYNKYDMYCLIKCIKR